MNIHKKEKEDFSRTIYAKINALELLGKELKESIRDLHSKNELEEIPGVGKTLTETIREFLYTRKCEKLERLKTMIAIS